MDRKQLNLATYTAGGWRFIAPVEGLTAFVRSSSIWATFRSGAWEQGILRGSNVTIAGQQVIGGRIAAIAGPAGGGVVDVEARSAVGHFYGTSTARTHPDLEKPNYTNGWIFVGRKLRHFGNSSPLFPTLRCATGALIMCSGGSNSERK